MFTTSHAKLRAVVATLTLASTLVLSGCGPEAPPCSDPESMQSILTMVGRAHDDRLKGMPYASKDLATFTLDAVAPTAYDDKLKLRNCKAVFVMTLQPDKAAAADTFVKAVSSQLGNLFKPLSGLAALVGASISPFSDETKLDVAQLQMLNPGPVRPDPIRRSLVYQIQKQEGSKEFMVSTNVDVSGTLPYLRVAAQGTRFVETHQKQQAEERAETAKKEAEVDRLSASGDWRRVVYIKDFGEAGTQVGDCFRRGQYCFQGWDGKHTTEAVYYELDGKRIDERGRESMNSASRARQPICLIGVQKASQPGVFTAKGYSTFLNEQGEAVDCLPGAEKQNWGDVVAKTKAEQAGVTSSSLPAQTPATSPASASAGSSAPDNIPSLITRYEACGEEAVCLHTSKGSTVHMQASQMRHADYAMLDDAIKNGSSVCLREVVRTEGKHFTAESLDTKC